MQFQETYFTKKNWDELKEKRVKPSGIYDGVGL